MKNLPTDEGDGEENWKIIKYRYCQWKKLLTWIKDREWKTEIDGKRRDVVRLMRDLDDKRHSQNKVLCSFSRVELPMVNYHTGFLALPALERRISSYPPASDPRTVLTRISPYRLFLVASFGTLLSAFCWSPLFPLCKQQDCWLGHGRNRI